MTAADPDLVVYGSSLAPAARKVLAVARLKQISVRHYPVASHHPSPGFRAASPFGRIPAIQSGGFSLSDSTAICHYLERRRPHPQIFPAEAQDYGRVVWFDQFAEDLLGPVECKLTTNLVVRPMMGDVADLDVVDAVRQSELPPLLDYLEAQLDGPFLVGGAFTLADIAVTCPFASLRIAGQAVDARKHPRLAAYIDANLEHPALRGITD